MRNQVRQFLRSIRAEIRDIITELLAAFAAMIAIGCVLIAGFGMLCLLGWGVAALWQWGPTTSEDRGWGTAVVLIAGVGGALLYTCIRDLRRWVLRHWHTAQRDAP